MDVLADHFGVKVCYMGSSDCKRTGQDDRDTTVLCSYTLLFLPLKQGLARGARSGSPCTPANFGS